MNVGIWYLLKKLFSAGKGYLYWHHCAHKYSSKEHTAFILIPSGTEEEMVNYTIKYLPPFIKKGNFQSAVFLLPNAYKTYRTRLRLCKEVSNIVFLGKTTERDLLSFYNANMNDARFVVASFTVPAGRNFRNYLRTGKVTAEELFKMGIYRLEPDKSVYQHLTEDVEEICVVG